MLLLTSLPSFGHTALRPPSTIPEYRLQVSFDFPRKKIKGQVVIQAPPGQKLVIDPGDLSLTNLEVGGRRVAISRGQEGELLVLFPRGPIHLTYEATLTNSEDNSIDENGLILQGMWYPQVEGFCRFKLTASLPAGFVAVSEADRIIREEKAGQVLFHFDFPYTVHDSEGLSLVASNKFVTSQSTHRNIELWTYLLPEQAPLAARYLERTKVLLEKYENMFGPYPYRRFAVVESFLKPSLALPTYVLLNSGKLRDMEAENPPLDHELVHQWLGCAVSPDFGSGNWSEGLATYFSDHLRAEEKGAAWIYRRQLLAEFQNHELRNKVYALRNFTECSGPPSRSVGYGKGAMLFHMLRQQIGDQSFFSAINQFLKSHLFAVASWKDLQKSFEGVTKEDLSWFFQQWVEKAGQPHITIKVINVKKMRDGYTVDLAIWQEGPAKKLTIPMTFKGQERDQSFQVELGRGKAQYSFLLDFQPEEVVIDENYNVFRALLPAELLAATETMKGEKHVHTPINGTKGIRHLLAKPSDHRAELSLAR